MSHPVVIIGAGPIGLAGAAHAQSRGLETIVLEAGRSAGAAVREWGHVRLFSPWSELTDPVAAALLDGVDWQSPTAIGYPTGDEWVAGYLQPLADALEKTDEVEVRYGHRVVGVTRFGRDRLVDSGREDEPLVLQVETGHGVERITASAVVDASGTWGGPNPLGGDGLPALGETAHADRISYRVPDVRSEPGRQQIRRQARRGRRHRRLRPERPRRAGPARRDRARAPGSPGWSVARRSATRSAAGTTTSSKPAVRWASPPSAPRRAER